MSDLQPRKVDLDAVRTRRARIKREMELLRAEDQELMVAEAALVRLSGLLATAAKEQKASGGKSGDKGGDQLSPPVENEIAQDVSAPPLRASPLNQLPKAQTNPRAPQAVSQTGWARPLSQRDYILMALDEAAEMWLGSREVQAFVHERWGVQLPTQSMRPLLTNMKQKGDILRKGRLIASRRRALEHEHPALLATSVRRALPG